MTRRSHPVWRDEKLHVNAERCESCVFRPDGLQLAPGRLQAFIEEHLRRATAIVCHELYESATPAVCRGFYDLGRSKVLQLAERMGVLVFQDVVDFTEHEGRAASEGS